MSWFQKILPNCCSSRGSSQPKDLNKSTISLDVLPEVEILPSKDLPENPKSDIINYNQTKTIDEESKGLLCPNISIQKKDFIESRRSTNCTITALDSAVLLLGTFTCFSCSKEAEGYCPACPNRRFCQGCYMRKRKNYKGPSHAYVAYSNSNKRISNKRLSSVIKVKSLM